MAATCSGQAAHGREPQEQPFAIGSPRAPADGGFELPFVAGPEIVDLGMLGRRQHRRDLGITAREPRRIAARSSATLWAATAIQATSGPRPRTKRSAVPAPASREQPLPQDLADLGEQLADSDRRARPPHRPPPRTVDRGRRARPGAARRTRSRARSPRRRVRRRRRRIVANGDRQLTDQVNRRTAARARRAARGRDGLQPRFEIGRHDRAARSRRTPPPASVQPDRPSAPMPSSARGWAVSRSTPRRVRDRRARPKPLTDVERHLLACASCAALVRGRGAPRRRSASHRPPLDRRRHPVGRYSLLRLVGRGGVGEVYAATILSSVVRSRSRSSRRHVRQRDRLPRLLREAHAIARLSHANVVALYDVGIAAAACSGMELIGGDAGGLARAPAPDHGEVLKRSSRPVAGSPPRTAPASFTATSNRRTS